MDATRDRKRRDVQAEPRHEEGRITVHKSSPDRTVFTEEGNTDGWIATDLTLSLER